MIVDRIDHLSEFDALQDAYEGVYRRDPHRTLFVSWSWLRAYFATVATHWCVLAVRDGDTYVAFCALVARGIGIGSLRLYAELALGANPTADYAGLIAEEEAEPALDALARALDAMPWDTFHLNNVSDPRIAGLVDRLRPRNDVAVEPRNPCRFVALPRDWSSFLDRHRERHGRQELRYILRRLGNWRHARLVDADDSTIDRDIETLLQLNHARWRTNLSKARFTYGRLFREAYARGCCRVTVLWNGEKPLAAQAAFVDQERRTWGVYMLGYDGTSGRHSPGIGMLTLGLERAIAQGYSEYDFLRGDEPYKARFGTQLRWLENFTIRRRSLRSVLANQIWVLALRFKMFLRRVLLGKTL